MLKNITARQIAIFSALMVGFIYTAFSLLVDAFDLARPGKRLLYTVPLVVIFTYVVNLFFLKKYIFRKIKLIYKTIHQLKIDPTRKQRQVPGDKAVLEEVEREVESWAKRHQQEIEHLMTLENYRREYLGNVSHELKTPIFNIQGYVHTLLDGGLADGNINVKYLERTAKNVERLITIVEDLETISKLESGQLVLDVGRFDIRELTREVFETHDWAAQKKKIQLQLKEGAQQAFQVKADREYIRRVLDNLILNSIKYGKENGNTKVGFYDMDKYVLIEIADNGVGMEPHHLRHVFDRFYRVDKSRSREVGGSGLGLSIVKHIIEAHNQTINVRSSPGLGSTFGFTLAKA